VHRPAEQEAAAGAAARAQRQHGASASSTAGNPSTRAATAAAPSTHSLSAGRPAALNESSATVRKPALRMPEPDAWFSGAYATQNRSASLDSAAETCRMHRVHRNESVFRAAGSDLYCYTGDLRLNHGTRLERTG